MLIIAEEMPKIDKGLHTATFLATIKANDWELVKSLKSKSQPSGPVLEKSIKEVLKAFYDADHHEL